MSVQISTPCLPTTSICSGDYGCGSSTSMAAVARIMPVFTGAEWDSTRAYGALEVVEQPDGTMYISKCPVPAGTPLDNCVFWVVYNENMWTHLEELKDGMAVVQGTWSLDDGTYDVSVDSHYTSPRMLVGKCVLFAEPVAPSYSSAKFSVLGATTGFLPTKTTDYNSAVCLGLYVTGYNSSYDILSAEFIWSDCPFASVSSVSDPEVASSYGNGAAFGVDARADGYDLALGYAAEATSYSASIEASVALGAGSKADEPAALSIGSGVKGTAYPATRRIVHVSDPVDGSDAATKEYVDSLASPVRLLGYEGLDDAHTFYTTRHAIELVIDVSGYGAISSSRVDIEGRQMSAFFLAEISEDGLTAFDYSLTSSAETLTKTIYKFDGTKTSTAVPTYAVYYR